MRCLFSLFLSAARTYIHGRFPSSCYRNALGSVPPACVRVVSGDAGADYAHGLTAPVLQVRVAFKALEPHVHICT